MDPITIGAIITAITSVISMVVTSAGQKKTLKANEQITAQQQDYNKENMQAQYEYTRPQTQAADLRATGMSEAAIMQALSGANVGQFTTSAIPAPDMGAPIGSNIATLGSSLGNLLSGQASLQNAETNAATGASAVLVNQEVAKKTLFEMQKLQADTNYTNLQFRIAKETAPYLIYKSKKEIDLMFAQERSLYQQMLNWQAQVEQLKADTKRIEADTELKKAQADLTREQEVTEVYKQEEMMSQKDLHDANTNKVKYDNFLTYTKAINQEWRNYLLINYGVIPEGLKGALGVMTQLVDNAGQLIDLNIGKASAAMTNFHNSQMILQKGFNASVGLLEDNPFIDQRKRHKATRYSITE